MYFIKFHNRKADSLAEYALVLGIVSLALIGMNMYIKRGFQGRMKEMSDKFISSQQVNEMDPTTVTNSLTKTMVPNTVAARELLSGGAIRSGSFDQTHTEIQRHSITQADPLSGSQEATQGDAVNQPVYGDLATQQQAAQDGKTSVTGQ